MSMQVSGGKQPAKAQRPHAIVVGAGLAGLSATFELLERGCFVTLIDKAVRFPAGNSAKASIGLCAPGFYADSAKDSMDDVMVESSDSFMKESVGDVMWLLSRFNKMENGDGKNGDTVNGLSDFCSVLSPGKKGSDCVIGAQKELIGHVLSGQAVLCLAKLASTSLVEVLKGYEVTKLLKGNGGELIGCECIDDSGMTAIVNGTAVIIATGGYGGDSSDTSLMLKYKPQYRDDNSVTDERTNGSGIKIAMEFGAGTERLDEVNLYPLACSAPGLENDRFRIVLSTLLLGAGGVLLDKEGKRFCDEKSTDPKDISQMMREKAAPPFRLVVKSDDLPENVTWLCDFYMKNGVLKAYTPEELARDIGVAAATIEEFTGRKQCYAQVVSPAIYTCTGGVKVNKATGAVQSSRGYDLPGLYAAGEVAAGPSQEMYAKTGVPLLHCIYSGKAAGLAAATFLNGGEKPANKDLTQLLAWLKAEKEGSKKETKVEVAEGKLAEGELLLKSKEELIAMLLKVQEAGPPATPPAPVVEGGPPTFTEAEVAQHNKKEDAWIIVNGEVIDIVEFIPKHPGGVQAICQYLGKDASEEWNTIHKKGYVQSKGVPLGCKILGKVGNGSAPTAANGPVDDGISWDEIKKHDKRDDVWVVINGQVIDATKFVDVHPGGVTALMGYAGKDASEEWNTIHRRNYVETKGVPMGAVILGKAAGGGVAPPPAVDDGYVEPESPEGYGALDKLPDMLPGPESFKNNLRTILRGPLGALLYVAVNLLKNVLKTVLMTGNFRFNNERMGTIRSGLFLVLFTVLHSSDNQFTQLGKKQYNGMSFFLADTMQKVKGYQLFDMYIGLCVLLHVSVGLKRSWDLNMGHLISTGRWNYMLTGLCILGFLTSHLIDFRFGEYFHPEGYVPTPKMYVPPYGVTLRTELPFAFFYQEAEAPTDCLVPFLCGPGKEVEIRDLYTVCDRIFQDPQKVLVYVGFCLALVGHLFLVWPKICGAGAFQIPTEHQKMVANIGQFMAVLCGCLYVSVPIRFYLGVMPSP